MSYILEALKQSQQTRELGQVPTLETPPPFSDQPAPAAAPHWAWLAVGLATLAVVIALYAAFNTDRRPARPVAAFDPTPAPDMQAN